MLHYNIHKPHVFHGRHMASEGTHATLLFHSPDEDLRKSSAAM